MFFLHSCFILVHEQSKSLGPFLSFNKNRLSLYKEHLTFHESFFIGDDHWVCDRIAWGWSSRNQWSSPHGPTSYKWSEITPTNRKWIGTLGFFHPAISRVKGEITPFITIGSKRPPCTFGPPTTPWKMKVSSPSKYGWNCWWKKSQGFQLPISTGELIPDFWTINRSMTPKNMKETHVGKQTPWFSLSALSLLWVRRSFQPRWCRKRWRSVKPRNRTTNPRRRPPDRVRVGGWVGGPEVARDESGQIRSWPQTRPGTWNGGLVREIPDNFRENLGWWNNIVWQWMDKWYIFT